MSPVSRKRKKPARRRSAPGLDAIAAEAVTAYRETLAVDGFAAELFTAELLGGWWQGAVAAGTNPEAVPRALVRYAAHRRTEEALAALLALAHLGTSAALRDAARAAATRLTDAGVPAPGWADQVGPVAVLRCALVTDAYGEQTTVLCEYRRGEARHALSALLDHDEADGAVVDAWFSADPDELFAQTAARVAESDGVAAMASTDPGRAARLLRAGFARLDEWAEPTDSEDLPQYRALALARLRDMPGDAEIGAGEPTGTGDRETPAGGSSGGAAPGAADGAPGTEAPGADPVNALDGLLEEDVVGPAVEGFLASAEAAALTGHAPAAVAAAARVIAEFGADEDERPLRIGPGRLGRLLHGGVDADDLDDPALAAFPAVVVAWTRYTARLAELPPAAVEDVTAIATECGEHVGEEHEELSDDELAELLDRYVPELDGADLDPAEAAAVLERRLFAVPATVVELDGEELDLDPSDPDDRRLLIVAEHGGDPDDSDPHVTLHEIVAEQLWRDEPPQAWQAARRLLDAGADRTDILHVLGEIAARHVRPAGAEYADAAHAAELDALGR
ncbi:hypothetical protein AB0I55_31305 [Actinocatenispora sera]|uniref:hypothetical protein n=1 Tax=Actinocatenispora sera TaxID=390989 RepID=UPI00340D6CE4